MKTRINSIVLSFLLFLLSPCIRASSTMNNMSKENVAMMTDEQKQQRLAEIKDRVEAIKAMDKSTLTKEDRVELKDELKQMKHEAKVFTGRGVYISLGALIIIILLLIIIF